MKYANLFNLFINQLGHNQIQRDIQYGEVNFLLLNFSFRLSQYF